MGLPMAQRMIAGGHRTRVYDRVAAAVAPLVEAGAVGCPSAAAAADGVDIVLLSLPGPSQVVDVVTGAEGVLDAAVLPGMIIDLSTNSVETVRHLRRRCADSGVAFVDAPVSGGVARARTGSLAVMVGAEAHEYRAAQTVLCCIGTELFHVGPPGAGAIAKIVNNQLFLAASVAVQEAYVLGAALGMDVNDLHAIVAASSAGPYAKLAPLLLGRRFDDVVFRLDIAEKDLALAVESAEAVGADVPLTRAAQTVYKAAFTAGDGQLAFHATLRELERRVGVELPPVTRPPRQDASTAASGAS